MTRLYEVNSPDTGIVIHQFEFDNTPEVEARTLVERHISDHQIEPIGGVEFWETHPDPMMTCRFARFEFHREGK